MKETTGKVAFGGFRVSLLLFALTSAAPATIVVDFNAAQVVSTGQIQQFNQFGLNITTPVATSGNPSGYSGPDLYIAINKPAGGAWQISEYDDGGLRVRLNNTSHAVDALYLFKTDALELPSDSDVLQAGSMLHFNPGNLSLAVLRFVVEDAGSFYISDPSPNFATSYSVSALSTSWYQYDPTTQAGVSVIGSSATPSFQDVDFVGFLLMSVGNTAASGGANFGVREFSVTTLGNTTPAYPFPQAGDYTGRGLKPNRTQGEMDAIARSLFTKLYDDFVVGSSNDVSNLCLPGEMRFSDGGTTRANMQSWMMEVLVTMDDGTLLNSHDGSADPMRSYREVFDRMLTFYKRFRRPGLTGMYAGVEGNGTTTANINAGVFITACLMAHYQWGDPIHRDEALAILDDFHNLHVVATGEFDGGVEREVIKAGAFWGYSDDNKVIADMAFASPAYLRAYDFLEGGTRWSNPRSTTYWMIDNLRARAENQAMPGISTGLFPNFMGLDGQLLLRNGGSEYIDELDTSGARYKYALDYLFFANAQAQPHLRSYADWWIGQHPSGSYASGDPQHTYAINGSVVTAGGSITRAGGLGVAAMVAGASSDYQNMVDSSFDHCVGYANSASLNSFLGLHNLFHLLIMGGNWPAELFGAGVDGDGDGASDIWESDNGFAAADPADGGLDADLDGTPNWLESQLGTDPRSDSQRFTLKLTSGDPSGELQVVFGPVTHGLTFELESKSSLDAVWQTTNMMYAPDHTSARQMEFLPPSIDGRGYYRMLIER